MKAWEGDKRWSDKFLPEIKAILGVHLIAESNMEDDSKRNTDLMVLTMGAVRIGCRVRRPKYIVSYGDQFTIRSERLSGTKTELAKIVEGWGDYFFYGFADQTETKLAVWSLCDLKVFRAWVHDKLMRGECPGEEQSNADASSNFQAFKFADLPKEFVIATNRSVPLSVQAFAAPNEYGV